ncbi:MULTISPECIES: sensor histidine kinase [unclassified Streptococcus]|uniref:sensor histidine kinase n=1 Tax=unclassified Streptococcus TaxID=2608887 RepID=UPI001071644A|nr:MULTISPECIES: sensor histidine kinase [unclassified Streptococcus]MBF0787859.1 sensor histidine kinase [Streptococcus sp. 19428wC2_LYSM12]MCQ9211142.1 sensor histidine kinase [Streptococcus sp. B01]MCQ9214417.1 sensor histidine kinase [Streptococcus sp. O1]TFV05133.1 sensor histidine kinase [Streptococcus sp. LYSM12]
MKKGTILLLAWYASLIVLVVLSAVFPLLQQSLFDVSLWTSTEQFIFTVFLLIVILTFFLVVLVQSVALIATQGMRQKIRSIIQNKNIRTSSENDQLLLQLSEKVRGLTRQVQLIDNQDLVKKEEIVESERRRIARDLHDTVSQELFASSMILSGLSSSLETLQTETLQQQLEIVKDTIETAQRDLRILLLHLRPSELDGKDLVEGFEVILREVSDKSAIEVHFHHEVETLATAIEEQLFRIGQEIISNTLRHSKARHLDVYLVQSEYEVQLKMTDDGVGFVKSDEQEVSYGLQNIQERVEDMAGTLKIRTAPDKGVAIDIRVPLLKGREHE